jgi:flagellar biogenesis protein FliO
LVGVTAQSINALHVLEQPIEIDDKQRQRLHRRAGSRRRSGDGNEVARHHQSIVVGKPAALLALL